MNSNRKLPDGVELSKDTTVFYPEGNWSFRKGNLVWGQRTGWRKYYEVDRAESNFQTAEEAIKAWERSAH